MAGYSSWEAAKVVLRERVALKQNAGALGTNWHRSYDEDNSNNDDDDDDDDYDDGDDEDDDGSDDDNNSLCTNWHSKLSRRQ